MTNHDKEASPDEAQNQPSERARVLREVALAYAAVTAVAVAIARLRGIRALDDYIQPAIALLFLYVPFRMARYLQYLQMHRQEQTQAPTRSVARELGIDLAGVAVAPDHGPAGVRGLLRDVVAALPSAARETGFALGTALVVLPIYTAGFWLWRGPTAPFTLHWPEEPIESVLAQLVLVGLPEEALFRGYLQSRLGAVWRAQTRILGAEFSIPAWVTQAAAFALIHFLVDLDPRRLAVFFPGLLFGWVRARRGGIGAGIVVHALCNLFEQVLERGWL